MPAHPDTDIVRGHPANCRRCPECKLVAKEERNEERDLQRELERQARAAIWRRQRKAA